ncbi:hypothetical protein ElyMa_005636600 [Elysia marginata]|uniref:Uncharacterized protein n=1 Tax=Elysia marginata TaxID=1093978 RepID=A0AAV4F9B0_9GAST|nr:hypothetical protein ElyMa_005636600 [Elysia marginata]
MKSTALLTFLASVLVFSVCGHQEFSDSYKDAETILDQCKGSYNFSHTPLSCVFEPRIPGEKIEHDEETCKRLDRIIECIKWHCTVKKEAKMERFTQHYQIYCVELKVALRAIADFTSP